MQIQAPGHAADSATEHGARSGSRQVHLPTHVYERKCGLYNCSTSEEASLGDCNLYGSWHGTETVVIEQQRLQFTFDENGVQEPALTA